jgi:hypothetical protein
MAGFPTPIARNPPALAASTPLCASSKTKQAETGKPSPAAAFKKTSGCGLGVAKPILYTELLEDEFCIF